ncbi:MAG TPA: hypothetical protein VK053_06195 [Jiangellaceae bacterium]|nr:hypothetical protein [Jiangellaceae bacterium]
MNVAVVGGGFSAAAIERALIARDASTERLSRSRGFDVLRDDAVARLAQYDVIVEATGLFTTRGKVATDFFTRSTRALAAAAGESGARHILLSIVNCELPEVQGYGYFAGKSAQEQLARQESQNLAIVRSTQWFDFARQNLSRLKLGPIAAVPTMTIKPVALDAVAEVIADCVTGVRTGPLHEVAGPEVMTLWEMTTQLPDKTGICVPLPIPGRMGRAFRAGALAPYDLEVVGPRFSEWLGGTGPEAQERSAAG